MSGGEWVPNENLWCVAKSDDLSIMYGLGTSMVGAWENAILLLCNCEVGDARYESTKKRLHAEGYRAKRVHLEVSF